MNFYSTTKTTVSLLLLVFALVPPASQGQTRHTQTGTFSISISGTSTMHDWTMKSDKTTCDVVFETDPQGRPTQLISLTVSVPVESLKSGKSGMDKNAYSAMKTDKYKQITFKLTSAKIDGKTIKCLGDLTIAGITRQSDVEATYTISPNGSIQCKGSRKVAMSDYNVEPPSFMFGTVTTGNEIIVSFDVTLAPKVETATLN